MGKGCPLTLLLTIFCSLLIGCENPYMLRDLQPIIDARGDKPDLPKDFGGNIFIITGGPTAFTARMGTTAIIEDEPIQTVIDAIRTHTAGNDCMIQFGSGAVLNIGNANIEFSGTWGEVNLTGSVTGSGSDMITLGDSISINSTANITTTTATSIAIRLGNTYTGTLNITGGTVSAGSGRAIVSEGTGLITISGNALITSANTISGEGTIHIAGTSTSTDERLSMSGGEVRNTAPGGNAIYNTTVGGITISGGTVRATPPTTAYAVYSAGTGALNIDWDNATIIGLVHPVPVITITTQPAATTSLTVGSISGSLSTAATVTLDAIVSYQWYSNTSASTSGGTQISGATGTAYTIPTNLATGIYYYYCVVSATLGAVSVATEVATVIVQQSAVFTFTYTHITEGAPLLDETIIISRTGVAPNNTTATFQVENSGSYSSIEWIVNGGAVTGSGASFQINAANNAYNAVGVDHYLTLIVVTNAIVPVPYERTVTFRVVQ